MFSRKITELYWHHRKAGKSMVINCWDKNKKIEEISLNKSIKSYLSSRTMIFISNKTNFFIPPFENSGFLS